MSYRLIVRPEVDADLLEAEAWYEQQEEGLGREFLRDARDTIDNLSANPLIYQVRSRRHQVRWAFPQPKRVSKTPDHGICLSEGIAIRSAGFPFTF